MKKRKKEKRRHSHFIKPAVAVVDAVQPMLSYSTVNKVNMSLFVIILFRIFIVASFKWHLGMCNYLLQSNFHQGSLQMLFG
jgi:hypothetical protein